MKNINFILIIVIWLSGCGKSKLDIALEKSDTNRKELEQVLTHYSQKPEDSLKLRAARFLIENLPGHYSYSGKAFEAYTAKVNSIFQEDTNSNNPKALKILYQEYVNLIETKEDIYLITADFLIDNIDKAFIAWQNPWAKHVGFEDFCEYILPYKALDPQPMEIHWRDSFLNRFNGKIQDNSIYEAHNQSAYWTCIFVNETMRAELKMSFDEIHKEIITPLKPTTLARQLYGNCPEKTYIGSIVMRSKGIPVAIDYLPQFPYRNDRHYWNVLYMNSGKTIPFLAIESDPGLPHRPDEKKGKVFRYTYAPNDELVRLNQSETPVPNHFKNIFQKDVTPEYCKTRNVTISVSRSPHEKHSYAYLAVFNNQHWIPIQWGKVRHGKVCFKNMERNIVYQPIYYTNEGMIPCSSPFILDHAGKVEMLIPQQDSLQVRLTRKYPLLFWYALDMAKRAQGAVLEASNQADFHPAARIDSLVNTSVYYEIPVDTSQRYRYWRYRSPQYGYCNISEIIFYQGDSVRPLYGKIIGTDSSYRKEDRNFWKEAAFDNDLLTFFDAPDPSQAWVGMDYEQPVKIGKIVCIPRMDGNNMQPNDTYELFYADDRGWKSLGKQVAHDFVLYFDQVPSHALLWLHNHSRGEEERIFTYENGKQKWW